MKNQAEASSRAPTGSPLEGFVGTIAPTKTGLLYKAGLAVVAFAMVLLPLIYIALIALTAWGVLLHLKNDTWLFDGASGRAGLFRLILYLGPAGAGGILVFFMVKPFFAARAKPPDTIALDPAREPLLFAFVKKICGLVGAPVPYRVDVDCQVNASASLRRGLWSRDLLLTIGLPLASGLDMRQFAGVLAHEFGHFAQGAGMRLTYVIRKINFWFARVVYERDAWDVKLEETAKTIDWRIGIVLHAGRGCVWVTRRILWALMHAGHAISCFMLRQMEYDADSYEAKIAGSDAFEATASRLRLLNVATQIAYEDVRQSWTSNRLPENLPLLIDHKAGSLPEEIHQKLSASADSQKTGWFDTHPCDADRVAAARRLREAGVFRLTEPTTHLFSDFAALSKLVTRHQYEKHFQLKFTEENLMSAEEILRESAASAEADAMVRKYFGQVHVGLLPLLTSDELPPVSDQRAATADWRKAQEETERLRGETEKSSADYLEQKSRHPTLNSAYHLAKAGFRIEPKEFGLPEYATSAHEQETAAGCALEELSTSLSAQLAKMEPFISAMRQRVTLALALHQTTNIPPHAEPAQTDAQLVELLAAVGAEIPNLHQLASKLPAFMLLVQNRGNHSNPEEVSKEILELAAELQGLTSGIQQRLNSFPYPFDHARGRLTVAEYARSEQPSENDWHRAYLESDSHIDRLFALNYRLIGTTLARVQAAEKALEFAIEPLLLVKS